MGLLAGLLAVRDAHRGLYGDGPLFVALWREGVWVQAHFLLLPLAIAARSVLAPLWALDRAGAIRAISVSSTALGAGFTQVAAAGVAGPLAALAATLALLLAPASRFYAGAVEVHALAFGLSALAAVLVLAPRRTRARARSALAAACALCAAAHLTLFAAALPLLLLHLDAERRAARAVSGREVLRSALAAGAALLALALLVLALDRLGAPAAFAEYSAIEQYRKAMVAWNASIPRPELARLFALEVLAPLGALPWLALPGLLLLARSRPFLAAGCTAWFALLAGAALKVGAREHGAYVLPAAVGLACAAAAALRHAAGARSLRPALALAGTVLCGALALRAFGAAHGLDVAPSAPIGPWSVARAELGLGAPDLTWSLAAALPCWAWCGLGVLCAIGCTLPEPARGNAGGRAARWSTAGVALLVVLLQCLSSEASRARWPAHWRQPLVDIAERLHGELRAEDVLVAFAPNPETKWTLDHFLAREWFDLGALDGAPPEAIDAWIAAVEERCARARAAGARARLSGDALAALLFDAPRRPVAHALALRWIEAGMLEITPAVLPEAEAFLRLALPARG